MNFELTAEQQEIQALARELADAEIAPHAADWDREHRFPEDIFARLAEVGLMGVCVPEEYGGAGADFLSYILVLEQLSRADAGVGVTVAVHTSATTLPILAWGTEEQKSRFVPRLARGETIGAFALSEPDVGSDASRLRCAATRDGDDWVISGQKRWSTNAKHSDTLLLFARTDPETPGARGISAFLLGAEHVQVTREEDKLGLNSSSTGDLVFDQARVAADRMLGAEGEGFAVAMSTLDGGADRHRCAGARDRAGGVRRGSRIRAPASLLRAADRPAPGDPVEARRHGGRDRGRAAAHVPRCLA